MNDSIQSIRFSPQIHRLKPKERADNKEGRKENKKDFSKFMSTNENGMKSKGQKHINEDYENTEQKKQNDKGSLQEKADDDLDSNCGTMLDTEI